MYGKKIVEESCPGWDELVDDVTVWVKEFLIKASIDDLSAKKREEKKSCDIQIPLNIGCPSGNQILVNISQNAAMRVYFGKVTKILTKNVLEKSRVFAMTCYGSGSGSATVGTVPDMVKQYPIEYVPCLERLLDFLNKEVMVNFNHCKTFEQYQKELNHIEMKIYLGGDIVQRDDVDFEFPKMPLHRAGDRPMSEVNWHCDYSTGSKDNSMAKDSYALSLSLGNPRWVCYRRQWINEKASNKKGWTFVPQSTEGKHKFFFRMEHGSLNILDPRDEDGKGNMRFKHKGKLSKNSETEVDGTGISVVLVCRSCPTERVFFGPPSNTPFYAVVDTDDMKKYNETADGKKKNFSGTGNSAGTEPVFRAETCHEIANNPFFSKMVKDKFQGWVRGKIIEHVSQSNDWKTSKKTSGFQWKKSKKDQSKDDTEEQSE